MKKIYISIFMGIITILSFPPTLWANRGAHDYGIIMAFMFIVYCFPIGLLLIGFIIYSVIKLKETKVPNKKQGKSFSLYLLLRFSLQSYYLFYGCIRKTGILK